MKGFKIKTEKEIKLMAEAGRRLGAILHTLSGEVRAGMSMKVLDQRSFELIKQAGCKPAFLGYQPSGAQKPYPATLCVSLNDVVVHGVPTDDIIRDGDLVKLDLGLVYKGWYADAAVTVGIGSLDPKKRSLIETTKKALELGIKEAAPGKTLGDIGFAIEQLIHSKKFSIVDMLTGHGIGRQLHEEPAVYNFGSRNRGERLEAGMVFAIEPMVAAGSGKVRQLEDDSFATADGSLAAHFEHTVAITEQGPVVLTKIQAQ